MVQVRFHDSINAIAPAQWDALIPDQNPFVQHAFLAGLEQTGCIHEQWGWQPHHLGLWSDDDLLLAAAPLYLKTNSHGEYVFDWSWAEAWERAGGNYYPKLLCAVPYSPVTGPRLLVGADDVDADIDAAREMRQMLTQAMVAEAVRMQLSSAHIDFLPTATDRAMDAPWLARFDLQYHWHNHGYRDFDQFLAGLRHKKRKNIRRERTQVRQAGLRCGMHAGDTLSAAQWQQVHALYRHTFDSKGNHPTLTLAFFEHLARHFGPRLQVALATRAGDIVAMALFLCSNDTLYGRYWGCREPAPCLHFELCYYQGIEFAIQRQLRRFEPGAQGEHKLARGFVPTRTHSRHYLVHPGFRQAVADALREESASMAQWEGHLLAHSPYVRAGTRPHKARP